MVLWFYSDRAAASSQGHDDRWLLHSFQRLICQMRIWCGEPSPAECTAVIAGTASRESVTTVIIWLWESIWGGWVLIFHHSLNNMFAWKVFFFYYTWVRWLVFEVLFLPTVDVIIYCMCSLTKKKLIIVYPVIWMCYLSLHNYAVSFVYMFVLLHAVKSNYNRIQIFDRFYVSTVPWEQQYCMTKSNKWYMDIIGYVILQEGWS